MHFTSIAQTLAVSAAANVAPLFAKTIFGSRFARPVDFGLRAPDGRPLLGPSKTWRGLVAGIGAAAIMALVLGLGWRAGGAAGGAAMAGDLAASFVKRRMALPPSSRAIALDQIPESLLPALALRQALSLGAADIAAIVVLFFAGEVVFARAFHHLGWRDEPY